MNFRDLLNSNKTLVMGILNVTPDSFSDGGDFLDSQKAVARAKEMELEGADIIDIGCESSRPGAEPLALEEELARLKQVLPQIREATNLIISVDTYKSEVAEYALEAGADVINDISGFRDEKMLEVCAKHKCGTVAMHMQGVPKTMQENPNYEDVVKEILEYLENKLEILKNAGIADVVIDPGIGFGKSIEHNLELLRQIEEFVEIGPTLVGVSRKGFVGKLSGMELAKDRDIPSVALAAVLANKGVKIVRVHNVKATVQALKLTDALIYKS